jgi:hypothetical protein
VSAHVSFSADHVISLLSHVFVSDKSVQDLFSVVHIPASPSHFPTSGNSDCGFSFTLFSFQASIPSHSVKSGLSQLSEFVPFKSKSLPLSV